jgi:hypothetical protein
MYKYEIVNKIRDAILNGERIIIISGTGYTLPERQRSGTYSQQNTYAMLKAKEIVYGQ